MLAITPEDILQVAVEVDSMQRKLLQSFFLKNLAAIDLRLLTDFPKSGVLEIDGESWAYQKHGLGYSFESERGNVIDVHNHFSKNSRAIDAHRIIQYLASSRKESSEDVGGMYSFVENVLKTMEKNGLLEKIANAPLTWRLML